MLSGGPGLLHTVRQKPSQGWPDPGLKQDSHVADQRDRVAFVRDKSYLGGFLINIAVIRAFSFLTSSAPNPERLL